MLRTKKHSLRIHEFANDERLVGTIQYNMLSQCQPTNERQKEKNNTIYKIINNLNQNGERKSTE